MTKKFEIIPIEDYGVIYSDKEEDLGISGKMRRTIATINKRIDDIPLIEIDNPLDRRVPFYQVYNTQAGKECNSTIHVQDFEDLEEAKKWCDGKAHLDIRTNWIVKKAAGGYSEEDMRNCWNHPKVKTSGWGLADVKFEEFIKSLQPKLPKSVVLETFIYTSEPYAKYSKLLDKQQREAIREERVKITNPSTNTIIPISYE